MKTYKVSFYLTDEKGKKHFLGANNVDVYLNDKVDMMAKAFRQAKPQQQMATETQVQFVKSW